MTDKVIGVLVGLLQIAARHPVATIISAIAAFVGWQVANELRKVIGAEIARLFEIFV